MVKVYYEEYHNDYFRPEKTQCFYGLSDFEDWFFEKARGKYADKISAPNPDNRIWSDGPSCLECNCMWEEDKTYWVRMIVVDGGIIYSDGKLTNNQKHWNETAKEMCRRIIKRKKNPTFNFI